MRKPTRGRTDNVVAMPSRNVSAVSSQIEGSRIAGRAFELYCERGCVDGHDVDDWLQAEREFRQLSNVLDARSRTLKGTDREYIPAPAAAGDRSVPPSRVE